MISEKIFSPEKSKIAPPLRIESKGNRRLKDE
jgi:hypothetical protein